MCRRKTQWTLERIKNNIKVNNITNCHEWLLSVNTDGYARLNINGNENIKAHRFVYSLQHPNEDIHGKVIRHK